MTFDGNEIHYSALANDILGELKTAVFTHNLTESDFSGISEGVMVMELLRQDNKSEINKLRNMTREERRKRVLSFSLEHEEEIYRLMPEIIERMKSAQAAMVESEAGGKPHSQAQESLQP